MVVAPDHSAKRRNGVAKCSGGHAETTRCGPRIMVPARGCWCVYLEGCNEKNAAYLEISPDGRRS
jgi:hypothetical protein